MTEEKTDSKVTQISDKIGFVLTVWVFIVIFGSPVFLIVFWITMGQEFFQKLVLISAVTLMIFTVLWAFEVFSKKMINRLFILLVVIGVGSIPVYLSNRAYHNSIPAYAEHEVDLRDYAPFGTYTKAVTLEEQSTLQLETNLPRIDGATALYPLYAAFVRAIYPNKQYALHDSEVMSNTTLGAYANLIRGDVDIIFAAAPSEQQLAYAEQEGVELKLTPIGREAFVFFVNEQNQVRGLTVEQIKGIYSGKIKNWKKVGGSNEKIRAFQRPQDSGSQTTLQKLMGDRPLMTSPKQDEVGAMGGIIKATADYKNYKNAIGYSFLYYATEMVQDGGIRLLEIDGVAPTKETIVSNEYPLAAPFYAVTVGSDNPNVQSFIDWILSPQGQYLVEKTGYTAIQ